MVPAASHRIYVFAVILAFICSGHIHTPAPAARHTSNKQNDFFQMSLEELMEIKVVIAPPNRDFFQMDIEELMEIQIVSIPPRYEQKTETSAAITTVVTDEVHMPICCT